MFEIAAVHQENSNVSTIIIKGKLNEAFSRRRAGQFALLGIPESGERSHPFTLSGAPESPELQMTIKNVGPFTSRIHQLTPGVQVNLQGPYGRFCSTIDEKPNITMIAGGIGITPFLSVMRHFINQGSVSKIQLVWANNTEDDFFCLHEVALMTGQLQLSVTLVSLEGFSDISFSGEKDKFHLRQGYLVPSIFPDELKDSAVYLCGSPAMQDYALTQLAACGIDPSAVEKEKIVGFGS